MTVSTKQNAPMYMSIMISILLAVNGFLLKDFYNASARNDKELLKRVNEIERVVSLNTQILRHNKEEHDRTQGIIDFYHPRKREASTNPVKKEVRKRLKLDAVLNDKTKLKTENHVG